MREGERWTGKKAREEERARVVGEKGKGRKERGSGDPEGLEGEMWRRGKMERVEEMGGREGGRGAR